MGRLAQARQQIAQALAAQIAAQRGQLLCWVPVCLALGIGLYFGLRFEPSVGVYAGVLGAALVFALASRFVTDAVGPLALALALCLIGFLLAGARAHSVAEPVLGWRYYGPVEGRVIAIDRSQSDAVRLTLDQVHLSRVPAHRTPARVRVSLHGPPGIAPQPGMRVMTTAHLSPPSGAVEPGAFDFQRHAWFARLGAVGYSRVPLVGAAPADEGQTGLAVFRLRMAASAHIQARLPGDTGGIAAAITTGDRSAISQDALTALRASNLAHLLAISGLHMGLLTAVVFGALRLILAAYPRAALNWPTKGIAAIGALAAASVYLALSGGNVATQRAFIMVAVALGALVIGRRALSLRAVAVAAIIVLMLRPEALLGPGFQMSFAATTALVAVFGALRGVEQGHLPRWLKPAFGVFVSSLVAGLATAPIAAAHFNTFAHYGLIANLLSVPLMGVLVIPAAVLAVVLYPVGLDWLPLAAMGLGLDWILGVAYWVSGLGGARGYVVAPAPVVLPLLAAGGLVLVLWQGRLRFAGVAIFAAGLMLWQGSARPEVLISDQGTLVGQMTAEGRALSKAKGAGFVARNWLENDGTGASQEKAAALWPSEGAVLHLSGKRAVAAFEGCAAGQIVVASVAVLERLAVGCMVFDPDKLKTTGAVALWHALDSWRMVSTRDVTGDRLWTAWPAAPAQ